MCVQRRSAVDARARAAALASNIRNHASFIICTTPGFFHLHSALLFWVLQQMVPLSGRRVLAGRGPRRQRSRGTRASRTLCSSRTFGPCVPVAFRGNWVWGRLTERRACGSSVQRSGGGGASIARRGRGDPWEHAAGRWHRVRCDEPRSGIGKRGAAPLLPPAGKRRRGRARHPRAAMRGPPERSRAIAGPGRDARSEDGFRDPDSAHIRYGASRR